MNYHGLRIRPAPPHPSRHGHHDKTRKGSSTNRKYTWYPRPCLRGPGFRVIQIYVSSIFLRVSWEGSPQSYMTPNCERLPALATVYPAGISIHGIKVLDAYKCVTGHLRQIWSDRRELPMKTLRVITGQQVKPSVDNSIRRFPRRRRGRQYVMQFKGNDSVPDIALQVKDCSVNALLDTGFSETTISQVAVI